MARSSGTSIENNFVKGHVTEFSGLNFPENACFDTNNVVFDLKGKVTRRTGLDYEEGFSEVSDLGIGNTNNVVFDFLWKNVAGRTDTSFVVTQIGSTIYFFKVSSSGAVSPNKKDFTINLDTYKASGAPDVASETCQMDTGNSSLYITHPYCDPLRVTYDDDEDTVTVATISVKVRDFELLPDGLKNDEERATLSDVHRYNLYNAGWSIKYKPGDIIMAQKFYDLVGLYPATSDTWWIYKDVNGNFNPGHMRAGNKYEIRGTTVAPRGTYILDAFYQDRQTVSGITSTDPLLAIKSSSYNRPSTLSFMNGRIFLSGVNGPDYSNIVYFSQILKNANDSPRFYQNSDPTSETLNELLPNDGGVIVIPEASNIKLLHQIKGAMLVFASNGVWSITGSQGVGFIATDYTVEKVSEVGLSGIQSFVSIEGTPFWWAEDGIYTLAIKGSAIDVQSVSLSTIQSDYDTIPSVCKDYAIGDFNRDEKEIIWVYSTDSNNPTTFTNVWVLRVPTGAFFNWSIPTTGYPRIRSVLGLFGPGSDTTVEDVLVGSTIVEVGSEAVEISLVQRPIIINSVKFLTETPSGDLTYSEFRDTSLKDWVSFDTIGVDYDSSFTTGFRLRGEGQRRFGVTYITVFSDHVDDGSCYLQGIWDFANNELSSKYTTPQQVYLPKPYRNVTSRKLKLRGNGTALQLRFSSFENKPFEIIGWATMESVENFV